MTADFDDLLTGARQGDEAAFVKLFRATQPALLRYLRTHSYLPFVIYRVALGTLVLILLGTGYLDPEIPQ